MCNPPTTQGDAPSSVKKDAPSSFVPGRAADGAPIINSQRPTVKKENDPLLVGVRGNWYDVTNFIPYHPGGDVILEFVGRDATAQFMAYHSPIVLAKRKPVGTYDYNEEKPGGERMQGDWMKLSNQYEQLGYYKTPLWFVASRIAILVAFLSATLTSVYVYTHGMVGEGMLPCLVFVVGAICLAGFWQQSGFLMHDTMHNLCFHNRKYDQKLGWFCGNVFLGLSSKWWRDEHNEHHLFTNTAVDGVGASDPQMIEDVWIQDFMLDQFFHPLNELPFGIKDLLIQYQHLYFVPLCMMFGPYAIKIASLVKAGPRPMEYLGIVLHFTWVFALLSCFPTWTERCAFYGIAMFCIGVLSIQLLVSHYAKPFAEKETTMESGSWAKRQVESVVDIDCPLWLDWFHGGLHLHSPHHLFPRLPRCYYRQVHKDVLKMCKENGVELSVMPWFEAVASVVIHLKHVGEHVAAKSNVSTTKPKSC